jgi:uncharacterized damage-inducible protein DinB
LKARRSDMQRPGDTEYAAFYARYVGLVPENDILSVLGAQVEEIRRFLAPVSSEKEAYRYAEGKWSIRQVLGHLIDGERIFGYRAFCFSRGEQAALPSFDENEYVAAARSDEIPLRDLVDELSLVRQSNLAVLRRLDAREWARVGTASGKPVSVRAIAWVLAGHPRHHVQVLRERYGVS